MLKANLIIFALRAIGKLPLRAVHLIGMLLGWLVYLSSKSSAKRLKENLRESHLCKDELDFRRTLRTNIGESGKAVLETFAIWFKDYPKLKKWYVHCTGWHHVEDGLSQGKGIIFLTPHLGCFEITSLYFGQFYPITVLYRPPRQKWLMPLIHAGRERGKVKLAAANNQGVKLLLQALKRGEAIGILPDQAPLAGEGEWAPFFGRPAYTMTLASKLAEKTGAQVLMAFGERLHQGRGYHIHISPVDNGKIGTPTALNMEIERTIQLCPSQYLWMYDRYKVRR